MERITTPEWWRPVEGEVQLGGERTTSVAAAAEGISNALSFWALMAFTFVLIISPQSFIPQLRPLHIALVSAAVAGGAYLLDRFIQKPAAVRGAREVRIALWLALWALVTVPLSMWPGGSVAFFFSVFFKALIIFWLLSNVVNETWRLRVVAWALSLMAVPLALSAIWSFFSGTFLHQELSHGLERIAGYDASLTGNPNDLALMLNLILPLSVALFLATRKFMPRMLLLTIITLDVVAIVATYSRAGFLTLCVIAVTYISLLLRRRQRWIAGVAVALMLLGVQLFPSSYVNRLSTITNVQADRTASAQVRLRDTIAALKYISVHPLAGAGIGNNILALNKVRGVSWVQVHNIYLVYAVELGFPGLILFMALLWKSIKCAQYAKRRALQRAGTGELYYLAEGIGVTLIAFAIAALFYPDAYQFYFYYMAGLAVAAKSISIHERPASKSGHAQPQVAEL